MHIFLKVSLGIMLAAYLAILFVDTYNFSNKLEIRDSLYADLTSSLEDTKCSNITRTDLGQEIIQTNRAIDANVDLYIYWS